MPSTARDTFLVAREALESAVQLAEVSRGDSVGSLLRRGLTVTGFNLFETFLENRLGEIAVYLNGGVVQFTDLPEKLQTRSIRSTIRIASNRMRRPDLELVDLRLMSRSVGESLATIDQGMRLSALTWLWEGSNLSSSDFASMLTSFHVADPWKSCDELSKRVGLGPIDVKAALEDVARERHKSAHNSLHNVTTIWLRALPERLLALAFTWDSLISLASVKMRNGDQSYLSNARDVSDKNVKIRTVVDRGADSAEYVEGRTRAVRCHRERDTLYMLAAADCKGDEVLVDKAKVGSVRRWVIPAVS